MGYNNGELGLLLNRLNAKSSSWGIPDDVKRIALRPVLPSVDYIE